MTKKCEWCEESEDECDCDEWDAYEAIYRGEQLVGFGLIVFAAMVCLILVIK